MTKPVIRSAREGDREALISIATRTTRASYTPFLGAEAVEGWLEGGTVGDYFDQHLSACRVVEDHGEIVGVATIEGEVIGQMMVDCDRHRQGFGRALLTHVEAELFKTHPILRLVSFSDNHSANAFYAAQGWTPGEPFLEDGIAMVPYSKRLPAAQAPTKGDAAG